MPHIISLSLSHQSPTDEPNKICLRSGFATCYKPKPFPSCCDAVNLLLGPHDQGGAHAPLFLFLFSSFSLSLPPLSPPHPAFPQRISWKLTLCNLVEHVNRPHIIKLSGASGLRLAAYHGRPNNVPDNPPPPPGENMQSGPGTFQAASQAVQAKNLPNRYV
jgi:hypothetical protein